MSLALLAAWNLRPHAGNWHCSRFKVMDQGGACGNGEEEVAERATLAWGQGMEKRRCRDLEP